MCLEIWYAYKGSSEMSLGPSRKLSGVVVPSLNVGYVSCACTSTSRAWTRVVGASSWVGDTWPREDGPLVVCGDSPITIKDLSHSLCIEAC